MFAIRRKPRPGRAPALTTLVAADVEIAGDVAFAGGMRVDGRIVGDVVGRSAEDGAPSLLVLSATGRIEGVVRCGDAVINGSVTGDLEVEHRLELQSDARVCGTIRYCELQMDVGATVQGRLLRIENPAAANADNVVELGADKAAVVERR
jgi:cytoskeletal protein CcmA (bactofilin family)